MRGDHPVLNLVIVDKDNKKNKTIAVPLGRTNSAAMA